MGLACLQINRSLLTVVFLDDLCPEYSILIYKAVNAMLPFITVCSYKMAFSAFFFSYCNEIQIQD